MNISRPTRSLSVSAVLHRKRLGRGAAALRLAALLVTTAVWMGCNESALVPCSEPQVVTSIVAVNPNNVLSATVATTVRSADSVAVRFGPAAQQMGMITPAVDGSSESMVLPVFGLMPGTDYEMQVVAFNGCSTAPGPTLRLSTETLPADLPNYSASGSDPSPGYVAFAAGNYGLVIDNSGRVVWYHRFPNGPGLNFQPQRNGHYAARPSPGTTGEVARWVEIDPLGTVVRTPGCAHGLSARFHDLLAEKDGSFWLMCDEKRTVEVSVAGGVMSVAVLGTSVQHLSQIGEVLFEWSPFDHLDLDYYSIPVVDRSASVINWTHGNAIDLDTDGNLLISFRNLSQVIKVDVSTGAVLWRLGGERNQFSLENSSLPPFTGQHGVRSVGAGQIQLLDNLGDAAGSRVQSYSVDEKRRTATVTGSRTASGGVVAFTGGSTQRLPGGHTLVAFGSGGAVEEFDSAGNIAWKINGSPGYIFRATRIRSLYHPGTDDPR